MSTRYSIGQMNQLGDALEAADFTVEDATKLRCSPLLAMFRSVVRGQAEITVTKHIVDLDADPFCPDGWKVEEHIKGGQFEFDPAKIGLYLADQQKLGSIVGNELCKVLKGQPVFNANMLDFWLKNPNLIPEELKGKYTFFWGTKYRHSGGDLDVRCLYWDVGRWYWSNIWLGSDWHSNDPAAVSASI